MAVPVSMVPSECLCLDVVCLVHRSLAVDLVMNDFKVTRGLVGHLQQQLGLLAQLALSLNVFLPKREKDVTTRCFSQ